MQTKTCLPWIYIYISAENIKYSTLTYFLEKQKELEENIISNYLSMNQFEKKTLDKAIELKWRQYIMVFSFKFAVKETNDINLVEAGIADGLMYDGY